MKDIHPTAIVEDGARIGENVRIGAYSMIGADVELGAGVTIHPHVVVEGRTRIGASTEIFPFAGVGGRPQDTSYKDEPTEVEIGANCIIREHATVHRGTARGRGKTTIGDQCFLMIGAHVAHDCVLGEHVVLVNSATLGGHVEIGEHAILGGLAAVQQRTRVGAHAFIGGLTGVNLDIIPFASAVGDRARLGGLNLVGLKRRGYDRPTIHAMRTAYQEIFGDGDTLAKRVDRVAAHFANVPAVMIMVDFIRMGGDRPLCKPRGRAHKKGDDDRAG
jgi:UDP-N-acetylglucosamine acyltransferase